MDRFLILKGNEPDALLIHLDKSLTETESGMRPALAASPVRQRRGYRWARAAENQRAFLERVSWIHLGNLGIEIVPAG